MPQPPKPLKEYLPNAASHDRYPKVGEVRRHQFEELLNEAEKELTFKTNGGKLVVEAELIRDICNRALKRT